MHTLGMCGIAGFWSRKGTPAGAADLMPALDRLRHRGPDDEGYVVADTTTGRATTLAGPETPSAVGLPRFEDGPPVTGDVVLGHRRLSILDLSPRGHQPMATPDGRCWVVFNGEIYNYVELRAELAADGEVFATETDTEVILRAWQKWGPECLHRFNGDWALALLDLRTEPLLFLARDRWGVKPLYFAESEAGLWFASEAKALVGIAVPFAPARRAVARFLQSGELPPADKGATFFEGIGELAPGECLRVTSSGNVRSRWYDLRAATLPVEDSPPEAAVSEMAAHLERSVRIRLRSDVPLGSCLSGGVDSSAVVGTMRGLLGPDAPLHTFSAVYRLRGKFDESPWIAQVVAHSACESHETYPDELPLTEIFDDVVWHQDEPFSTPSIFAQWCVMREARRQGVTVLLDGQAADELLAGYQPETYQEQQLELLAGGRYLAFLRAFFARRRATGNSLGTLVRELRAILVFGVGGQRVEGSDQEKELRALAFREDIAAEFFEKATLDAGALREKLAEDRAKLDGWRAKLPKAEGEKRKALEERLAKKERQIASTLLKLARLTGTGLREVAGQRLRGRFSHDLRDYLLDQTTSSNLVHLLRYEDRNSMAFSIEARVPFTDVELVEWAFRRGNAVKIRHGWTKWVLRKAMAGKAPEAIAWRRDKTGFETPERELAQRLLASRADRHPADSAFLGQFLDPARVRQACDRVLAGDAARDEIRAVWRWLVLDSWHRQFTEAAQNARK
jgi:asparagine synthase (glutamine-hydrolysing)